jgi:hypothetical protein
MRPHSERAKLHLQLSKSIAYYWNQSAVLKKGGMVVSPLWVSVDASLRRGFSSCFNVKYPMCNACMWQLAVGTDLKREVLM